MQKLTLQTQRRKDLVPITQQLADVVKTHAWQQGVLLVFCPHTTGAITINESADPAVRADIIQHMTKLIPHHAQFSHAEGNSDAHIQTSLFGPHSLIIIENNELMLGTWQEVYFCEWDGPRNRTVWVQFLSST